MILLSISMFVGSGNPKRTISKINYAMGDKLIFKMATNDAVEHAPDL